VSVRPTPAAVFSFSRVKTFAQCPLRYRYRYVEGLEEAFTSVEAALGKAVHAALEWLYAGRGAGREPGPGEAVAAFDRAWEEATGPRVAVVRAGETAAAYAARGREMVARFAAGVFARDRSRTVALERRVSVRLAEDVVFTGIADRIGRTQGGRLFVVDYKTAASGGAWPEHENGLQARLYAAALLAGHPEEDGVLAGFHYLASGETRWERVPRAAAPGVWARFLELAREALAATEFPARPGVLCAWCGFNHRCPAARVPEELAGGLELARRPAGG